MENKEDKDTNCIFVGRKPLLSYVRAVEVQFTEKKAPEVVLRARGKSINQAVNLAEFMKREKEIVLKDIKIGSDIFKDKETNKESNVSSIEITLIKK